MHVITVEQIHGNFKAWDFIEATERKIRRARHYRALERRIKQHKECLCRKCQGMPRWAGQQLRLV